MAKPYMRQLNYYVCFQFFWRPKKPVFVFDPLGRPAVTAGSDHCFRTCCPSVHPSVPTFHNLAKQNNFQAITIFNTVRLRVRPSGSLMTPVLFFLLS